MLTYLLTASMLDQIENRAQMLDRYLEDLCWFNLCFSYILTVWAYLLTASLLDQIENRAQMLDRYLENLS